jgi:hypothetical protein
MLAPDLFLILYVALQHAGVGGFEAIEIISISEVIPLSAQKSSSISCVSAIRSPNLRSPCGRR